MKIIAFISAHGERKSILPKNIKNFLQKIFWCIVIQLQKSIIFAIANILSFTHKKWIELSIYYHL
jgi:CMP-N-acetylneuraminic acid synthetase